MEKVTRTYLKDLVSYLVVILLDIDKQLLNS